MKFCSIFIILAFLSLFSMNAMSQSVIINEVYNSSASTDEWVELLVVQDNVDLRSWILGDYTNAGNPSAVLTFSTNSLWSSLQRGTIIVIGQSGVSFTEDNDPSDHLIKIKATNATYFSGTVFVIGGVGESVYLKNSTGTHVFGLSWGSGPHVSNLPQPKVYFAGSSSSSTSTAFSGDATMQLTDTTYWLRNTPATTQGNGNNTVNAAWITSLRSRAEGSGVISIFPTVVDGGIDTTISLTYHRDPVFTITNLRVIVPPEFIWSKDDTDFSYTNMTASVLISNDTVEFSGINFTADSTIITIYHITTAQITGSYRFVVQSGTISNYGNVAPVPVVTVYGAPLSIAEVKINNTSGVALRIDNLVSVRGIITVGKEFGSPSYIQDNSGGMSIYDTAFSRTVYVGDEISVTGKVAQFSGLNQIMIPTRVTLLSSGDIVDPLVVTPTQLKNDGAGGVEVYEGMLVRVNGVTVTELNGTPVTSWQALTSGKNYRLYGSSAVDTVQIRIDEKTNIVGTIALNYARELLPRAEAQVVGISQP